ncbi:hypothetical protein ACUODJ_17600, partial [Escherichia sp. HC-CC]
SRLMAEKRIRVTIGAISLVCGFVYSKFIVFRDAK